MTLFTRPSLIIVGIAALLLSACGGSAGASGVGGGGDGGRDGKNERDGMTGEGGRGHSSTDQDAGSLFGHDGGHDATTGGSSSGGDGGNRDGNGSGSDSGMGTTGVDASFGCDGCGAFPPQGAPVCASTTLLPPTLVYPPNGVLLPPNMNVLEVQFVPPSGATLFEVDFTNAVTDVRVETPCISITSVRGVANVGCGLTLSQAEWNDIATTNANGDPVKVTVRAAPPAGSCATTSPESVEINFAKENLSGGIYYWQSATYGGVAGTTGGIYYHDFGTFDPTPTPFWTSGSTGTCVGCHTLTKDGTLMSLMQDDPDADDEFGDVRTLTLDVATRNVLSANDVSPGFQTFTHDDKYMVASTFKPPMGAMGNGVDTSLAVWNGAGSTLAFDDLFPSGIQGTQPNLSDDDSTVVFVVPGLVSGTTSISQAGDHHFLQGSLWSASFDESTGAMSGFAAFLTSNGTQNFYYPDQSSDGNWLVLDENDDTSPANNDGDCFYSRQARVEIMHWPPEAGATPIDLPSLNVATGLTNSWPRWSPVTQTYKGHQILWVTFSSNRDYGLRLLNSGYDNYYPPESPSYDQPQPASKQGITFDNYAAPQIWMAAIIVDPGTALDSTDRSFPAFWLPFQDVTAHNHSAQWVNVVQTGQSPDAGMGGGSDGGGTSSGGSGGGSSSSGSGSGVSSGSGTTSASSSSSAPVCGEEGATCGVSGAPLCCTDVVCCFNSCETACTGPK